MSKEEDIKHKITAYKKRFYLNRFLKGLLIGIAIILGIYLTVNLIEYQIRLSSPGRGFLFFILVSAFIIFITKYIAIPLRRYLTADSHLSNEDAALQIGSHFPEIRDKLLNIIQLEKNNHQSDDLVAASIFQKSSDIGYLSFGDAINIRENKRYLKYPMLIILLIALILYISPELITGSTTRIIKYQQAFEPQAPFSFQLQNNSLTGYKNESLEIKLLLDGTSIPASAKVLVGDNALSMDIVKPNLFAYTFDNVRENFSIQFEAAGYKSSTYEVTILERPLLQKLQLFVTYPEYLFRAPESIDGTGNIEVPEGSSIKWSLNALHSDSAFLFFEKTNDRNVFRKNREGQFQYEAVARFSSRYNISLQNEHGLNKEHIQYHMDVIADRYPHIQLDQYEDTVLYDRLFLAGVISDDYGLSKLQLAYRIKNREDKFHKLTIPISSKLRKQSFGYQWLLDSIEIGPSDDLEYYLKVWDNDGVNGSKSSKTAVYELSMPSKESLRQKLETTKSDTESKIKESLSEAKELQKNIEELNKDLKGKKSPDWKDKKKVEDLLEKRKDVEKQIEELKQQQQKLDEQNEKFGHKDEKIIEKSKKLQELMNELLDEETKKLYEELKKLLQEKSKSEDMQELLDKLENKEENLERELDKALEMFKQMKFDMKLEEISEKLGDLSEKQEKLAETTDEKKSDLENAKKEQSEIKKEFEDIKKDMKNLNELNDDLKKPADMEEFDKDEQDIEESLDESKEQLDNGKRGKASDAQNQSSQQMKKLEKKMSAMAAEMEEEAMEEDMDNLRQILDNLVKLSFEQENIMVNFSQVHQTDPRFISLSQQQLKLQRDAEIVLDSLFELSKRVQELTTVITREASSVENNLEESIKSIRARKKNEAGAQQQLCLTSINNLALMLDNVLNAMQSQMKQGEGQPKKKGKKKPGQSKIPGLSELQKQLNKRIGDLKKSGKSGRKLSEELSKLAGEQEAIRQKLKEMEKFMEGDKGKQGGKKGGNLNELKKQMEETELDLVRKQITSETIMRQKQIMTKLLEAEKSLREKELDNKREGKNPENVKQSIPPSFEEYLKKKEKEIELLKTVPLKLNSFYKKEVNDYFDRLEN